jgi:pimeloyl-ACP methyl ester carboxylesterase
VNGNLSGRAQEYRGRVLVLCGGEDHVTPVDACQEVAKAYSNSPFEILPKLGHASYVEGPKLFNTVVEDFLKTLDV